MKRMLLALAIATIPALAEEPKPIATHVGHAMRPAAEAYGKGMQRLVNEFFAGSEGPMGKAARANLKAQENRERETNREVRRSMDACIKPGNVIDDDVHECINGLKAKEW